MADVNFDSAFTSRGNSAIASVSGTPTGAPPILAIVFSVNKAGNTGAQPDATWSVIGAAGSLWNKVLNAAGLLAVSQTIAANPWTQLLAFFGSNGSLPVWGTLASGSLNNPGNGNSNVTGAIAGGSTAGRDLFVFMDIHANNGFFFTEQVYTVTDTAGNVWNFCGGIVNLDGAGNGAQVALFHCPNALALPNNGTLSMKQIQGDSAHFVAFDFFFLQATNIGPVNRGVRLLLSLGVGV